MGRWQRHPLNLQTAQNLVDHLAQTWLPGSTISQFMLHRELQSHAQSPSRFTQADTQHDCDADRRVSSITASSSTATSQQIPCPWQGSWNPQGVGTRNHQAQVPILPHAFGSPSYPRPVMFSSHQHMHYSAAAAAATTNQPSASMQQATSVQATPGSSGTSARPLVVDLPFMPNPVVPFRKAEDVVGRNSKLLKPHAYNKNLKPRQLVARIMSRKGINNMLMLLKLYQNKVDGIVVAAVLSKICTVRRFTPASEHAALDAVTRELLTWLEPFMRFQLRYCSVPTIAAILWGWAGLTPELRHNALPTDLAILLLARACQSHESGDPGKHKLRMVAPRFLALLAWSGSRVIPQAAAQASPYVQPAAAALAAHTSRRVHQFTPQGLSLVAAGLVTLAPAEGRALLANRLAADGAQRIGSVLERQFQAGELVRLLDACARVQLQHGPLFEKAAGAVLTQVQAWRAADVAGLAGVMAAAGVRHDALMAAVVDTVTQRKDEFAGEQVQQVLAACQKLGCPVPAEMDQLGAKVTS